MNAISYMPLRDVPVPTLFPSDKSQETSLHLAVRANDVPCVRRLLAAGANHRTMNDNHTTPLHSACAKKNVEIVKLLFKKYQKMGVSNKEFVNQVRDIP